MKRTTLFNFFFESEKSGGLTLIACIILSLLLANLPFAIDYHTFFQTQFSRHNLEHWINVSTLFSSLVAGATGLVILRLSLNKTIIKDEQ